MTNAYDYEVWGGKESQRREVTFGEKHELVLRAMRSLHGPATDEQILDRIIGARGRVISPSGARSRRAELVDMKLVKQGHTQGRTESGRPCKTWILTERGRKVAQQIFEAAQQLTIGKAA